MFIFKEKLKTRLANQHTFYDSFTQDLKNCKKEVIIESPFITSSRMTTFMPIFKKLLTHGVKIHIITRDPVEHDENIKYQATNEILECVDIGINIVLIQGNHHRKLAILDRTILWEGSLNILSQNYSQEIMRRIEDDQVTEEMFDFLSLNRLIK